MALESTDSGGLRGPSRYPRVTPLQSRLIILLRKIGEIAVGVVGCR